MARQAALTRRAFAVERRGAEPVPGAQRHGRPASQFTVWLGANLTIADFALGFLPISLGLPWAWTIAAVLVGNLLGALALAMCAAMGPRYGQPQMVLVRHAFGRVGGRLPAALNYLSTLGWYTVNTILGGFGLGLLLPVAFWQAALLLVAIQIILAVYGHNVIHAFERAMSVLLGLLFLAISAYLLTHTAHLTGYHPARHSPWPVFAIVLAAVFSYVGSWAPYASDYSRYLPAETSRAAVAGHTFAGAFVASAWLELVGVGVAVLAGGHASDPTQAAHTALGALGNLAVVAIVLGAIAANAVNLYSNSLAATGIGLTIPRSLLAAAAGAIGLALAVASSGHFAANYQDFLLLLAYWITPWLGVQLVDFYLLPHNRPCADNPAISLAAVGAFAVGIVVEVPFMARTLYTGPLARHLHGADISFYLGFLAATTTYLLATTTTRRRRPVGSRPLPSAADAAPEDE